MSLVISIVLLGGSVLDTALKTATKITTPFGVAAFALAILLCIVAIRKNKIPVFAWIVMITAIIVPTMAGVIIKVYPVSIYRITIVVVDDTDHVVTDVTITPSVQGQLKRSSNNIFEYDVMNIDMPSDQRIIFIVEKKNQRGHAEVQVLSSNPVSITIQLQRLNGKTNEPLPRQPKIDGMKKASTVTDFQIKLVRQDNQPIAFADVTCDGRIMTTTGADGEATCVMPTGTTYITIMAKGDDYFCNDAINFKEETQTITCNHE